MSFAETPSKSSSKHMAKVTAETGASEIIEIEIDGIIQEENMIE